MSRPVLIRRAPGAAIATFTRVLLSAVTILVMALAGAASAEYRSTPNDRPITDGPVHAIAVGPDGRIYLGGSFGTVGPATGGGVVFDSALAKRNPSVAKVFGGAGTTSYPAGTVLASVADGAGGWYVGGTFSSVGGLARANLAHIRADGTVDPTFDPEPDAAVTKLSLAGSTLFVEGEFTKIGGVERAGVAGLNTGDGSVTGFNPSFQYSGTKCGIVAYGAFVFVCDSYAYSIDGQVRHGLAELNAADGSVTSWDPQNTGNPQSLYVSPSGVLYVGITASFNSEPPPPGSQQHPFHPAAAAFRIAPDGTPTMLPFNPRLCCYGGINAFLQIGNTLYVGGGFSEDQIPDGQGGYTFPARGNGAAFDVSNNNYDLLPFDPQANGSVTSLAATAGTLALGGTFNKLGSTPRGHLSAVDPGTGAAAGSDPGVDGTVYTVSTDGSSFYVGGSLTTVGGAARQDIAVLNPDGTLASLAPGVDGEVDALAVSGTKLYVGGRFRNATGQGDAASTARTYLASFSTADGSLTAFNPAPDNVVGALAVDGANLYAGGSFGQLNGTAHGDLAAFSLSDGSLITGFDPKPNGAVDALTVAGSRLFAAGGFGAMTGLTGSPTRSHVAAFDLPALSLNTAFVPPTIDSDVLALAVSPDAVYVGGAFDHVGATYQPRLVALNPTDASLTAWNAQMGGTVQALGLQGSTLYAGGTFTQAGGGQRTGLAGLDTTTGAASGFGPQPDRDVYALAAGPSQLVIGGLFVGLGSGLSPYLASFSPDDGSGGTPGPSTGETGSPPPAASGLTPAPATMITDGPDYFTTTDPVRFAFTSDTPGSRFECSLDGGAFAPCTSPLTTPRLPLGRHVFVVRAVSGNTADEGGASEAFQIVAPGSLPAVGAGNGLVLGNVSINRRIVLGTSLRGRRAPGIHFRLSRAALVTVSFSRHVCRARRCSWNFAGTMPSTQRPAGRDFLPFSGKVSGGILITGAYRATITAFDASGIASRVATANFSLVKKAVLRRHPAGKKRASSRRRRHTIRHAL